MNQPSMRDAIVSAALAGDSAQVDALLDAAQVHGDDRVKLMQAAYLAVLWRVVSDREVSIDEYRAMRLAREALRIDGVTHAHLTDVLHEERSRTSE